MKLNTVLFLFCCSTLIREEQRSPFPNPQPRRERQGFVFRKPEHSLSPLRIPLSQGLWSSRPGKRGLSWIIPKGKDESCGFEVKAEMVQLGRRSVSPAWEQVRVRESLWVVGNPHLHKGTQ